MAALTDLDGAPSPAASLDLMDPGSVRGCFLLDLFVACVPSWFWLLSL